MAACQTRILLPSSKNSLIVGWLGACKEVTEGWHQPSLSKVFAIPPPNTKDARNKTLLFRRKHNGRIVHGGSQALLCRDRTGKPIRVPVTIRKMYLYGDFIGAIKYRIVRIMRKGCLSYSCSFIAAFKEKWNTLKLQPLPEAKWQRGERMTEQRFILWLCAILGAERGMNAFNDLQNQMPGRIVYRFAKKRIA